MIRYCYFIIFFFKNVTSDSHFVTVDFPHEVEVPPQSCTAGQVAHISYHCMSFIFKDFIDYSLYT